MKKIITALAFALTASTAMAADAVSEVPAAPVAEVTPVFTWSGPYLGVQGGYGWGKSTLDISGPAPTTDADENGGLFGAFVGYNYQFSNNFVLGVEGDLEHNWNNEDFSGFGSVETTWQGSVRGRIGYAFDRALIYGTAGWVGTKSNISVNGFGEQKEFLNGYTVGAGVDYAFTDNVFGRLEYRYNDFSDKTFDFGAGTIDNDFDQHTVKVGLGVKF